ncbi:hypothetical protein NG895_18060 [Aeoliella sp. ICT_H6.2]|uniref:Signal transducing protein n=1 Tax=Aeoliella straminimaris TaxID=2954799 RepID=A0A9X2JHT7_9BACT|nr:hypothetical protein [Aeoliella straminimaris]MCO6045807.1 hypothetical protein [Aeoliella straminimaris]
MASQDFITIATFSTGLEAQCAAAQLEAGSIPTCVLNGEIVDAAWFLGGAVGGAQLQVPKDDAEEARRLVEQMRASAVAAGDEAEGDEFDVEDRATESESNVTVRRALRAAAIGLLFLSLQFYSLYLIGKLIISRVSLDRGQRKKLALAAVLDCCVLTFVLLYFWPRHYMSVAPLPGGEMPEAMEVER